MMTAVRLTTLCLACLCLLTGAYGQEEKVSQSEIELQQTYIEGITNQMLGKTEEAVAAFEKVLEADPRNAAAAFELGRLYQDAEDYDRAASYFERAVRDDPTNTWYPRYLADLYQATGRHMEAAALFQKLASQYPDDRELYFKWAYFLVSGQDVPGAIRVFDELEKRVGIDEEISRRKHALYLGEGDKKAAERELQRLVDNFPNNIDFRHLLAGYYAREGEEAKAKRVYEAILKRDPTDAKAQLALQEEQAGLGEDGAYLASLAPIMARPDVDLDLKIGKLLPFITRVAETGNVNLANAVLELTQELERVHPDEAKPFSASGDLYYHTGRYRAAQEKYRTTLDLDVSVFPVWEQLLVATYFNGDIIGLRNTANEGLGYFPSQPILYYYLALAEDAFQQPDEALSLLDQALLMTARNQTLRGQLLALQAQARAHSGQLEEARQDLEAAEQLIEGNPLVDRHGAVVLLAEGKTSEAVDRARRAAELVPNDVYIQFSYAEALYATDQFESANELLQSVNASLEPKWPRMAELQGDVLFQLGQIDAAVERWQKANQLGSKSKNLKKKIADRQLYE